MRRGAILSMLLILAGCAANPNAAQSGSPGFSAGQLVKSDTDRVVETHQRELLASLKQLTEKLYKRNPKEWKKGGWKSAEEPVERLFGKQHNWQFPELEGKFGTEAVQLALKPEYSGDRVFAFCAGLGGMLLSAFNGRYEFFMADDLNAQNLYNASRNIEIAAWKIEHDRGADGELLLLTNEMGPTPNLSFERLFGRMIGNLDLLSNTIADKNNRAVVKVAQNIATAVFLPVAWIY